LVRRETSDLSHVEHALASELWREPQRRRLVRLCTAVSGDRDAAEDLAQETLLEAWRNVHKLHDPAGADAWLAAIARNVCRRWARRRGRDVAVAEAVEVDAATTPIETDLELDLERAELIELLDRALALLPPETRDVLVQRYVHESPHPEMAARLGLSADAVAMRLARGKVVLRRLLESDLRAEAAAHGLATGWDDGWSETRVWCSECGRRKLLTRREPAPGGVAFRCPGCSPDATTVGSEFRLGNPFFSRLVGDLVRPAAIIARASGWSRRYFAGGRGAAVACTRCGRGVRLGTYLRDHSRPDRPHRRGLFARCDGCGETVSSSVGALALAVPEVRAFRRDHPRTRALPERDVEVGGTAALVVRHEDALGSAGVDVVLARDTLRVLAAFAG
jgi:RNA polymerase sigma-70 factor (ECF subfamily)